MEVSIIALIIISLHLIPYETVFFITGLSFILQLSVIKNVNNKKHKKVFTNINLLILTSSILIMLLNLNFSLVNMSLLVCLSIQFLLIASQSIRSKSRNCFYIVPITLFSVMITFGYFNKITILAILLGIVVYNFLELKFVKNNVKEKLSRTEFENKIILNLSNDVQRQISKGKDFNLITSQILDSALIHLDADSSAIITNTESGFKTLKKTKNYIEINLDKLGFKPVIIENTEITKNKRFHKYSNERSRYISSIIILPITTKNSNYGYLVIQNNSFLKYFNSRHLETSKLYTDFIQTTLENIENNKILIEKRELDKEVDIASEIQQNLIPKEIGNTSLSIAVLNKPSKGMSGDYYNIIPLKDNKTLITICDVAGKGIPAALVTVIINTTMKLLANKIQKASTLLSFVNKTLCENINIERYATMSCLIIDPDNKSISYSNAGHHPTLLKRDKKIIELSGKGLPAGILKSTRYQEVGFKYKKNDILILYTDGVSESMNIDGGQFGKEGIISNLQRHKVNSPTHIVANILQESEEFSYQDFTFDDRTIIGVSL